MPKANPVRIKHPEPIEHLNVAENRDGARGRRYARAMQAHRFSRWNLSVLIVAILLLAAACGGGDDADSENPEPSADETAASGNAGDSSAQVRYMAIGDSLSQGIGGDNFEEEAFPARLAERWKDAGCTVDLLNAGISGYTAAQMITDQVPQIADFQPTIITFQSGANDIANGETEDAYRENVSAVLDAAVDSGATVYVLLQNEWFRAPEGPNYGGTRELRDAYDRIMLDEAESRDVEVLDLRAIYKQQADDDEWVEDGIHPTADAYDAWSEELADLIEKPC